MLIESIGRLWRNRRSPHSCCPILHIIVNGTSPIVHKVVTMKLKIFEVEVVPNNALTAFADNNVRDTVNAPFGT